MSDFSTLSVGSYTEQKINRRIREIRQQIADLQLFVTNAPFLVIYGVQEIVPESSSNWEERIKMFLSTLNINLNWILDITNTSKSENPDSVTINFISHCVKARVYTILSNYVLEHKINALISDEV
jgi:hypothetical protein